MAELLSLVFATLLHYLFRVTIFLDTQKFQATSLVGFSSILILISVLMFLSDLNFMPERYRRVSEFMYILIETIISIFLIEVFVVLIWSKLEVGIEFVLKSVLMENQLNLYQDMGGDNLVGFIIVIIATAFATYSAIVTSCLNHFTVFVLDLKEIIVAHFLSIKNRNSSQESCGKEIRPNQEDPCCRRVSFSDDTFEQKPSRRSRSMKPNR
ncbi:unnamed protein product [Diamesa serratosioi]